MEHILQTREESAITIAPCVQNATQESLKESWMRLNDVLNDDFQDTSELPVKHHTGDLTFHKT